ncbi:MAG: GNAT family N-acetyltransferase [Bacteroidales bacterium]|nr:GNAT family N-acetyltransferase [Bacteroidales bacterium]
MLCIKALQNTIAYSSLYYIGYIDTLWVDEKFRNQSIGTKILSLLESKLREYGCELCHLDTFNFQAPVFYKKNGYEIFGELHHKKQNITEYFLKKDLC